MGQENKRTAQNSKHGNGGSLNCHPTMQSYRNEFYDMDHKNRGKALIFSHDHYDLDLSPRPGTVRDSNNLEKCLKELGFSVDVFPNLKYAEIMKHIEETASMNHSKNDCLLIVVLTHGDSGILYAKDTHYSSEKLWSRFTDENCPSLAGKPKLFVFQACQGETYDDGVTLKRNFTETDGWLQSNKIPLHPDFLLALSTVPGYFAWRNTANGSWFIQALCEELHYNATEMDILTLLTFVNQKVALNFESSTDDERTSHKKAIPCFSSMLTRRLVFTKKPDTSNSTKSFLQYFKDCV